ncbi:lipopolysaccharide biosynthesis protein [Amphritea balenae]|uniref:Lipopolysaccharide biosynthesis protein n=1 Tax=Amphritea balenae TaxID=452629 RepID=A0A3P1SPY2_9GAMM|nr:lipopolysaccharide biosynthesis protein [Amphritea balenae]RRC99187.1 lipopolysaccharide biosynthesis protein [Amphritea balenae]GGK73234.1 lipopolysaccharide biosynthesis protein [Amphritea balenae]
MSLTKRTALAILWDFSEQLLRRGLSVAVTLLLAYYLAPEDFGLIAMMSVFLTLGSLMMDSGLSQSLIRIKGIKQVHYNTAFYLNILFGILAYVFLFFVAPYVSLFYQQPDLIELIRIAGIILVVNSFKIVQFSKLNRELNFKTQFMVNLPAAVVSGAGAVLVAYEGWGVWALVIQMLLFSFTNTIFLWMVKPWIPTFEFSFNEAKTMYVFGYKLFLAEVINTLFKNMYVLVIAKYISSYTAGLYFFSEKIKDFIINLLVSSIQKVTYPALATLQDDNERLKSSYREVISITAFVVFPAMLFVVALTKPIFDALLPERWNEAMLYLQLMMLASLLYPVHAINLNILSVKGRSDLFLGLEILRKILIVLIFLVSFGYGVVGILIGQIVSSVLLYIPNSYFAYNLIGYSVKEQLQDFMPSLLLAFLVSYCIYLLQLWIVLPALVELFLLGVLSLLLYVTGAVFFNVKAFSSLCDFLEVKLKK